MNIQDIISDPIFQLNILVWMAKEQPPTAYRIYPVFYYAGYRYYGIEREFPLPQETQIKIKSDAIDASKAPAPEMILTHATNGSALYFEAKKNSFHINSSNSKQARGHLIATGDSFSEVLGLDFSALLCYLTPSANTEAMRQTLGDLSRELAARGYNIGKYSCHGLRIDGNNIVYEWDAEYQSHVCESKPSEIIYRNIKPDTDPSPLLLVYTDSDYPSESNRNYARKAVLSQTLATLLSRLHLNPIGQTFVITVDELLMRTTDGLSQYFGKMLRKSLTNLIKQNQLQIIKEHWKDKSETTGVAVTFEDNILNITVRNTNAEKKLYDWLENPDKFKMKDDQPPEEEASLFDSPVGEAEK